MRTEMKSVQYELRAAEDAEGATRRDAELLARELERAEEQRAESRASDLRYQRVVASERERVRTLEAALRERAAELSEVAAVASLAKASAAHAAAQSEAIEAEHLSRSHGARLSTESAQYKREATGLAAEAAEHAAVNSENARLIDLLRLQAREQAAELEIATLEVEESHDVAQQLEVVEVELAAERAAAARGAATIAACERAAATEIATARGDASAAHDAELAAAAAHAAAAERTAEHALDALRRELRDAEAARAADGATQQQQLGALRDELEATRASARSSAAKTASVRAEAAEAALEAAARAARSGGAAQCVASAVGIDAATATARARASVDASTGTVAADTATMRAAPADGTAAPNAAAAAGARNEMAQAHEATLALRARLESLAHELAAEREAKRALEQRTLELEALNRRGAPDTERETRLNALFESVTREKNDVAAQWVQVHIREAKLAVREEEITGRELAVARAEAALPGDAAPRATPPTMHSHAPAHASAHAQAQTQTQQQARVASADAATDAARAAPTATAATGAGAALGRGAAEEALAHEVAADEDIGTAELLELLDAATRQTQRKLALLAEMDPPPRESDALALGLTELNACAAAIRRAEEHSGDARVLSVLQRRATDALEHVQAIDVGRHVQERAPARSRGALAHQRRRAPTATGAAHAFESFEFSRELVDAERASTRVLGDTRMSRLLEGTRRKHSEAARELQERSSSPSDEGDDVASVASTTSAYSAASSYASSSAASRAGSRAGPALSLAHAAAAPLPRYVEQSPGGRSAASSVAASLVGAGTARSRGGALGAAARRRQSPARPSPARSAGSSAGDAVEVRRYKAELRRARIAEKESEVAEEADFVARSGRALLFGREVRSGSGGTSGAALQASGVGRELGQSATDFDHVFATGADRSFGHALAGSERDTEDGAEMSRAGARRVAVHISRHGSVDIAPRNDSDRMTLDELELERDEDSSY